MAFRFRRGWRDSPYLCGVVSALGDRVGKRIAPREARAHDVINRIFHLCALRLFGMDVFEVAAFFSKPLKLVRDVAQITV